MNLAFCSICTIFARGFSKENLYFYTFLYTILDERNYKDSRVA